MNAKNGYQDICDEFGVTPEFVEFVWATLKEMGNVPGSKFHPRNKRECALAVAISLRSKTK
jgi:hypothetical protein